MNLTTGPASRVASVDIVRGAWLVLLEMTVIRVAWTFNLDFAHYLMAGARSGGCAISENAGA